MEDFYTRIDSCLRKKKCTQKDLCTYLGITPQSFTNSKTKRSSPSVDTAVKIAKYLNTTVEYLVTGEEPASPLCESRLQEKLDQIAKIATSK